MKKLLLASAVAALSVSAANAAPTIYGKAFITTDYVNGELDGPGNNDDFDANSLQINSNGSRIGFKGSEAMTADTDVVYQLEYGTSVDGDNATFSNRDTYLGLANKNVGEFRFGKNSSVLGYINNVAVNQGYWDNLGTTRLEEEKEAQPLNMADERRVNSSIVWLAPKYNGMPLELALMYGADESFVEDNGDRNNGYGASLMFDQGTGLTAGLAYSKDLDAKGYYFVPVLDGNGNVVGQVENTTGGDIVRGTLSYDLSKVMAAPVKVGVLYQQTDYDYTDSKKEKGLVVSGEMALSNFARPAAVYAQYNKTDNLNGVDDAKSDQLVVGGKYMYKNNMIMHAYAGANNADIGNTDADVFAIGGGLEYKF